MAQDIQSLIDKINREGLQAARENAGRIEAEAKKKAEDIVSRAAREAEEIIAKAKKDAAKAEEETRIVLKQAFRDLSLNFKNEINRILTKAAAGQIKEALTPQGMAQIIAAIIKDSLRPEKGGIVISLNKESARELEEALFSMLAGEIKKGITIRPSEDVPAGFLISFDAGKSHYDFSPQGLAEYISLYLKPKLGELFS